MKSALGGFKLYYEELERKTVKTAKQSTSVNKTRGGVKVKVDKSLSSHTISLKDRFESVKKEVRSRFNNIKKEFAKRRKNARKITKSQRQLAHQQRIRGIIGIGLLFVVVSIAYSTYMTSLFVDGQTMVAALAPQVIFAATILLIAFYKIYK